MNAHSCPQLRAGPTTRGSSTCAPTSTSTDPAGTSTRLSLTDHATPSRSNTAPLIACEVADAHGIERFERFPLGVDAVARSGRDGCAFGCHAHDRFRHVARVGVPGGRASRRRRATLRARPDAVPAQRCGEQTGVQFAEESSFSAQPAPTCNDATAYEQPASRSTSIGPSTFGDVRVSFAHAGVATHEEHADMYSAVLPIPTFLIIGAQKSATRWLRLNLGEHPDVFTASREIEFFNSKRFEQDGLDWYRAQFEGWAGERFVGEATPGYMFWRHRPEVMAERMRLSIPDVRLIAILRNPVDRAQSAVVHHVQMRSLPPETGVMSYIASVEPDRDPLGILSGGWYPRGVSSPSGKRLVIVCSCCSTTTSTTTRAACTTVRCVMSGSLPTFSRRR